MSKDNNQLIFYSTPQGNVKVEVVYESETFWLSQKRMAELFGVDVRTVNEHLKNIFKNKELAADSVIRNFRITATDGKSYNTKFYMLDAILAVGYRVNSDEATQFRIWATNTLKEYITKGFVLDDERLKQGQHFGKDYFDELLERIREIRASERRFYQKITDLYALSADYNKDAATTQDFFASVQNKLHWAITGKTAAELIYTEADATKIYMGLKTWKAAPHGKIIKSDVSVAKNYLNEAHISELNRIVSAYLDLAENNAKRSQLMYMKDWSKFLEGFLQLSNYPILKDKGKVTMLEAKLKAETEFDKYRVIQDKVYESDFDKVVKRLKLKKTNKK
ncbi:MAG: virulence RhuM family protein [Bacteroidetes bacterium]|nr:virulence RhuM family protein [Bacteroidota bacterium]